MRFPQKPLLALLVVLSVITAACGAGVPAVGDPVESAPTTTSVDSGPASLGESILVLGDSIMEWNIESGQSIPDVIEDVLGVDVTNASAGGASAHDVPDQYAEAGGDHDWVVFDGGGNDLNDECGCGECVAVADSIVSADGSAGVLASFTESLVADDRRVALVGYYEIPEGAAFGFDRCVDDLAEHNERLRALAGRFDSVVFVDPSEVVKATDATAFDDDDVHPSVEGSRLVGEQIAAAIASAG